MGSRVRSNTEIQREGAAAARADGQAVTTRPPRIIFLGSEYAGHHTRFSNLRAHATADQTIRPIFKSVTGWVEDGMVERLPMIGRRFAGRLRAVMETSALARLPRPDAIWMSVCREALPYTAFQFGPLRRPVVLDLDWTAQQQEELAPVYFGRRSKSGWRMSISRLMERAVWRYVTIFNPWSSWAADSLHRQGIPRHRIRVNPPGVDLDHFSPADRLASGGPLRLLFVGGDFERKGGDILLRAIQGDLAGRVELDIVTRDEVHSGGAVRVHRTEANSPLLNELLRKADIFVMPSKAECFGISTVEAMASGLPAIIGDVGAGREIVDQASTGWLVKPTVEGVAGAIRTALNRRDELPAMGRRARRVAEERFDGRVNDQRVLDTIFEAMEISKLDAAHYSRGNSS